MPTIHHCKWQPLCQRAFQLLVATFPRIYPKQDITKECQIHAQRVQYSKSKNKEYCKYGCKYVYNCVNIIFCVYFVLYIEHFQFFFTYFQSPVGISFVKFYFTAKQGLVKFNCSREFSVPEVVIEMLLEYFPNETVNSSGGVGHS